MMNSRTKKMICAIVAIVSVMTIVGTVSYAYFTASGEVQKQEATISTGTVTLTFADNDTGLNAELAFGESATKKFTMVNTGTADSKVKMFFDDIVNTYLEGSLTYTLSYSENADGPYTEVVSKTNVPRSSVALKKVLASSLTIPVGKTYYYNLVVTLNYLDDVNQDADINAVFHTKFVVDDINASEPPVRDKIIAASKGTLDTFAVTAPKVTEYTDGGFGSETTQNMSSNGSKYITYASNYTFDKSTGTYTLTSPAVCQYSSCYENLKDKYIVSSSGSTSTSAASSSNLGTIYKVGTSTTASAMYYASSSKSETQIDYSKDGIYEMEDDYGTSYYYRGAVKNNYVKFAGFYWRIIRMNGDGSLRILYDGEQAYANGVSDEGRVALTGVAWNPTYNDAKYVGYMYGGANGTASTSKEQAQTNETNTNIKTKLDEWYKTNIADKGYGSAVADAIFCNDRSTPGKDATNWSSDTGLGYGTNVIGYGALSRHINPNNWTPKDNPQPTLKCTQKNDAFTVSDTVKGNGALTYPVGLITADEISAAGGRYYISNGVTNNKQYYLYKGTWYWSLSPFYVSNGFAFVFGVGSGGSLDGTYVGFGGAVVPVINLSAEYAQTLKGTGTMSDPYQTA